MSSQKRKSSPTNSQPSKVIRKEDNNSKEIGNVILKTIQDSMPGIVEEKLKEFLPTIVAAIKEELKSLLVNSPTTQERGVESPMMDNSPPPPPPPPSSAHLTDFRSNVCPLLERRHRAYYQSLRHENIALALKNALENETPKVPRKFIEKIGRFDQPAIISKKIEMTRQNVLNEIEILRIYYDSDLERMNKLDEEIKNMVLDVEESYRNEASIFVDRSISKNVKISNEVIKKKLNFINSDKYLHAINDINFEKLKEIKKPSERSINLNNNQALNHNKFNTNLRNQNNNHSKKPAYSHVVQHTRNQIVSKKHVDDFHFNDYNNQNFQLCNQNFKKRNQFVP